MKFLAKFQSRLAALLLCAILAGTACKHSAHVLEVAYVSGVQVFLRDRVAAVYEKVGQVKNGDRVEILDRDRHFVKVRTATGQEGWMEQRNLVSQEIYDALQKLTSDNANDPVQAPGITRNDTNLHVTPGRETEHLYQISSGEKLAILKRGMADKNAPPPKPLIVAAPPKAKPSEKEVEKTESSNAPPPPAHEIKPPSFAYQKTTPAKLDAASPSAKSVSGKTAEPAKHAAPAQVVEDWLLVRDSHGRVGWVLARMVDVDVPIDIAQYAEGQRIVAFSVLNEVEDKEDGKQVPQYLMVLTEPHDGQPYDFNQIRVFTWNVKRHRYETAYRERFEGMLPVTVGKEDFGKEGVLPIFTVRALTEQGTTSDRKYKLDTPIVRRVLAPGEEQIKPIRSEKKKLPKKTAARKHRH